MDPNRAAADMIRHSILAEQHAADLRDALEKGMFAPSPGLVIELLDADDVECSPMRVRAALRALRPAPSARPQRRTVARNRRRVVHAGQLSLPL